MFFGDYNYADESISPQWARNALTAARKLVQIILACVRASE
jgi:hypothetical protein